MTQAQANAALRSAEHLALQEPEPECPCDGLCPSCRREYRGNVNRWRGLRLTEELTEANVDNE